MAEPPQVLAARAFVRDLNIVLKLASLYGLNHTRASAQFDITWASLQKTLDSRLTLIIGAIGDRLVINEASIKPSTVERTFISLLSAAAIASIEFNREVTRAELATLIQVLGAAKPGQLWTTLRQQVEGKLTHLRVHEFSLTGPGAPAPQQDGASLNVTASLAASLAGPQDMQSLLGDPMALLRAAVTSSTAAPAARTRAATEEHVVAMLRAFTRLGAPERPPADVAERPEESEALYEYLRANNFGKRANPEALLKIAETLTIRAALEKYESGDVKVDAVRQMLRRFSEELEKLRTALRAQGDAMSRAGLDAEPYLETLDRQFWDNLPDAAKLKVLLSPDAWCIPGRHAASFLQVLLNRGELQTVLNIVENYVIALRSPDAEARAKSALAIGELAAACAVAKLLEHAMQQTILAVLREQDTAIRKSLMTSVSKLAREAESRHDFEPLRVAWTCANAATDVVAAAIRATVIAIDRVPDLLAEALATPEAPLALMEVLRYSPEASMNAAIVESDRCRSVERRERLVRLLRQLGEPAALYLRRQFSGDAATAIPALSLLARLDHPLLELELARKVRGWSRNEQDAAIRQVAASGAVRRGQLLLSLLNNIDRLVAPLALDEIGMSESQVAMDQLLQLARGEGLADGSPFLQVKAVECITRLEEPSAVPELINIITARRLFGYRYPSELRVAALQALLKIVPDTGRKLQARCGIGLRELSIAPLPRSSDDGFLRQRRFPRITPRQTVYASAATTSAAAAKQKSPLTVDSLSMVGGSASLPAATVLEGEARIELHLGLRRVQAQVIVRQTRPFHVGFEVCDMPLEDRYRLRQFLAN